MKNKSSLKKGKQTVQQGTKYTRWIIGAIIFLVVTLAYWYWSTSLNNTSGTALNPSVSITVGNEIQNQLVGRWVRTDSEGNYIIEIKSVAADGKLAASYFNPNPIKVGRAEWQQKNGSLMIVVELRDVNYPGSTYTLNFNPSENRMTGNYYQAVEGANFNVEFVRAR